jgi:hypothetical protein
MLNTDDTYLAVINIDLDHFRARVLQDCLTEATARYWERRAQQFEDAAPRKGDRHFHAPADELLDSYERCMATALACRRHAQLLRDGRPEDIKDEIRAVEVA